MDIKGYINENISKVYHLLKQLCLIPAPSGKEEQRAQFCKKWFDENCGSGAYIDQALNVVFPYQAQGSDKLSVVVAHTDTVFPDPTPMPYIEEDDLVKCPGVGDDTASLVVMMFVAKYFVENSVKTKNGILFVANSCEEGLGNLKGVKQLFNDYQGRVAKFISFDASFPMVYDVCVGSHRYEVEVRTKGGHSWGAFGNKNAIAELSKMVSEIYSIEIPKKEGKKATYNVGIIEGGTSVNTIAQSAKMLCEYRSDDKELLAFMQQKFEDIFEGAKNEQVEVVVTKIGDRPCMGEVDQEKLSELASDCAKIIEDTLNEKAIFKPASTDCNIPLSLGIPAIAIGVCKCGGAHTREEWLSKSSLKPGLEIGILTCLKITQ